MTAAYVNSASTIAYSATSYSLTQPSGITQGNILLAAIIGQTTVTAASGWTPSSTLAVGSYTLRTFYRTAGAGETTSSAAFTMGFAGDQTAAAVVEVSGGNSILTPVTGGGTYGTTPAITGTTATSNTLMVAFAVDIPDVGTLTFTKPASYTERLASFTATGNYRVMEVSTHLKASGAFTDTWTASSTGYSGVIGIPVPTTASTYSNSGLLTLGMTGSGNGVFSATPTGGSPADSNDVLIGRITRIRPYVGKITRGGINQ